LRMAVAMFVALPMADDHGSQPLDHDRIP
jgi:hypothetical protein